jgi:predicted transcriptional regulator
MKSTKSMTIRLSADQAEALEMLAEVERSAISDVIRAAISDHIEVRRRDPHFQEGLRERIKRAQQLLERQATEN